MTDILNKFLAVKREEVAAARAVVSDAAVREIGAGLGAIIGVAAVGIATRRALP